ncbi:MAG: hypothetical protein VZR54_04990 [Ruminococcus sp.]|nr:hypothetical protein [Ruminococcus sp.]
MKRLVSIIITLAISVSVFMFPANAETVISKSLMQYKDLNLTFSKAESANYKCSVTNNDGGYIKVDANNEGANYWLMVKSQKPTSKAKPKITVTDTKDGSVVKSYEITVTAAKKIAMKNVKINVKSTAVITVKNPYNKNYKLKYNKKILKYKQTYTYDGKCDYTFVGLKKGKTAVQASIDGKVYGKFVVTVGDFKSSLKSKKQTLKYNKHIKSYSFEEGGKIDIADAVKYYHTDATYTVKIQNKKIAAAKKLKKSAGKPKRVELYSLKNGKTKVAVYEKRSKTKTRKVGTFMLTVKKVKDSEVVEANMAQDNDGLFYEFFIHPGETVDLKSIVARKYINGECTTKKFAEREYKITITAGPEDALKVDENGNIKCLGFGAKKGENKVTYTITFADGSKVSSSGSFSIMEKES